MASTIRELADIQTRKLEIREILKSDAPDGKVDLDALEVELNDLEKRQTELETQERTLKAIRAGSTVGLRTIESRRSDGWGGDERRMEFANDTEQRRASQEYREVFYRHLLGQGVEKRDLITTTTGAAVVPTTTFDKVVENVQKATGLLSRVRILNIPGKLAVPTADIQTAATWHTEGAPINDSNVPPNSVTLGGYELVKLFSMSAATQRMSINAFESYLVDELTRCTRDALADAVVDGEGTTEPIGVLNGFVWDATNSVVLNTSDMFKTLTDALALLAPNFSQNAVWAMNTTTLYTRIATIATSDGVPLIARDPSTNLPKTLLGKALELDDFVPDDTIILGDPRFYFLNFSQPMAIEASREAGFTTATVLYRSLAVVDGRPVAPAFVKIDSGE